MDPQPTMTAVCPARSEGSDADDARVRHRRCACWRMICGKCRFSASTPATAVWATDWALTPDEGVTSTPRACNRSEEHTSELQSLMRISYAVFCLKKKKRQIKVEK